MSEHFIRPDNDPEPTDAEIAALAGDYQLGLDKMIASGYEEFGPERQRQHALVIAALRAYAETPRERFEHIVASLHYDGNDTNSLTVGEIRRALR